MNATESHYIVETSGPLFVSYSIQCMLYGALCVQMYLYYLSFPRDAVMTKALVWLLQVVVTLQLVLKTIDIFRVYVHGFLDVDYLDKFLLAWLSVPILGGLVGFAVQLFFTYRVWTLTKSRLMILFLVSLAILQLGCAIAAGILDREAHSYSNVRSAAGATVAVWSIIWIGASAACDVVVAATLTYNYCRKKSGPKARNAPLAFVIAMAVETGFATAFTATAEIIVFFSFRGASYYIAPAVMLAVLYANSCKAVLNSRIVIAGGREATDITDVAISSAAVARHTAPGFVRRFVDVAPVAPPKPAVQIQTEVWNEAIHMEDMKPSQTRFRDFQARDEDPFSRA